MNDSRRKNKEDFRREILDAAREIFSRDGYGNFSMRKLAKRIGYSPTTIYLYFRDKDELLFSLSEELFAGLYESITKLRNEGGEPREVLRGVLRMYVESGVAHPEHYKVAFFTNQAIYGSPDEYLETDTVSRRSYFLFRDMVEEFMEAGVLGRRDPDTVAQALWAGVHGVVSAVIYTRDFPLVATGDLADTVVDAMLAGLGA